MPGGVLVVDAGGHPLEPLGKRLASLGYAVVRAKTGAEARAALTDARRAIGAVAIPPDPPTLDLGRTLRSLTGPDEARTLVVCGPRPEEAARARLRDAGARLALFEPWDDATIRFQVNRALAGDVADRPERRALRVPVEWPVEVRSGRRGRPARLVCLSARGAFLETARPALRKSLVHVTLPIAPLGGERLRLACEVVSTNVPGNLRRGNLPLGMGVRFLGLCDETARVLERFTAERARELSV